MFLNTLSGRFLALTILFVMLAEVFIFVPSIARFRRGLHAEPALERAQIASLALLANDMIGADLEAELLENAGVSTTWCLRRDEVRQLMLASDMPQPIVGDLRHARPASAGVLIRDAMMRLLNPEPEVMRVIGNPDTGRGAADRDHHAVGAVAGRDDRLWGTHSAFVGGHLGGDGDAVVLRRAASAGETDQGRGVGDEKLCGGARGRPPDHPAIGRVRELSDAEAALKSMQTELTSMLRQRERLASWVARWRRSATICGTS